VSNDSKSPDVAALLQQLVAAPGGVEALRQLFAPAAATGMPAHPDDLRKAHEKIWNDLQARHLVHLAAKNRAKGHPDPQVGDTFYAWLTKPVRGGVRTREGINFEVGKTIKLAVVDDADLAEARAGGVNAVTVAGMERVFDDDTLVVNRDPLAIAADELAAERDRAAAAEAKAADLEKRIAELQAAARQTATDPGDGSPGRLKAAAKARAEAEEPKR
jgi:hypothetical protein